MLKTQNSYHVRFLMRTCGTPRQKKTVWTPVLSLWWQGCLFPTPRLCPTCINNSITALRMNKPTNKEKKVRFPRIYARNLRTTVKGNFSPAHFVSSSIEEVNVIDLLLNWKKDFSSCDYWCANLNLVWKVTEESCKSNFVYKVGILHPFWQ